MRDVRVRVQRGEYQHGDRGNPQRAPDLDPASIPDQHGKGPDEWKPKGRAPPSSAWPDHARNLPEVEQADEEADNADRGLADSLVPVAHGTGFLERGDRTAVHAKVLDEREEESAAHQADEPPNGARTNGCCPVGALHQQRAREDERYRRTRHLDRNREPAQPCRPGDLLW